MSKEPEFEPDECFRRTRHCFRSPGWIMGSDDIAGICEHCGVVKRLKVYYTMPGSESHYRGVDPHGEPDGNGIVFVKDSPRWEPSVV